jgi:hypothetical protein
LKILINIKKICSKYKRFDLTVAKACEVDPGVPDLKQCRKMKVFSKVNKYQDMLKTIAF